MAWKKGSYYLKYQRPFGYFFGNVLVLSLNFSTQPLALKAGRVRAFKEMESFQLKIVHRDVELLADLTPKDTAEIPDSYGNSIHWLEPAKKTEVRKQMQEPLDKGLIESTHGA